MFTSKPDQESECQLPEKCGNFGVCEDNQCVACPTPNGLMGWSRKETSKCLITSQLNTLTRVSNPSHLAFIKVAK
ncbi:hypothetical protein FRX31_027200 [Thalictrum thalictroides]|uniref:Uncharacterized protein n=1 Tax=Thalictrum thalictroides TaxID=46969 RepID=A0A7J6VE95_THATH|nr:hypothetical protein FRX31_027200 [Thalictrum thalictroides]